MKNRRLTQDGTYTLYSEHYGETYHSMFGGKTEAAHVFLKGAGVLERFDRNLDTRILEVGFGAGLNFMLTADAALRQKARLEYWALENRLLPADTLASLEYDAQVSEPALVDRFLTWRSGLPAIPPEGLLSCRFSDTLSLHLVIGDAIRSPMPDKPVDAVYLDAFSPDQNPELWTVSFLEKLFGTLKNGGKLATYSAKSQVRKNLLQAGFRVSKYPGPPGKREMLVAVKT